MIGNCCSGVSSSVNLRPALGSRDIPGRPPRPPAGERRARAATGPRDGGPCDGPSRSDRQVHRPEADPGRAAALPSLRLRVVPLRRPGLRRGDAKLRPDALPLRAVHPADPDPRTGRPRPSTDGPTWSVSRSREGLGPGAWPPGSRLLGAGGALGANAVWNAPERVAIRHMEQAEQLAEGGRVGDAAGLLAGVARGSTDQAQPAARRLAELLDNPYTKRDPKAMLAVLGAATVVKKAGRWPAGAPSIIDRGRDAARSLSASAPKDAVLILDELDQLGPADPSIAELRHSLLEAAVAADPSDAEWASRLAVDFEARGQLDRCEKFLEPLRHRLGELEGARVLAMVDARANRLDRGLTLLRAYTKPRLGRLRDAEAKFQLLVREGQERVIKQLENQRPSDFDYERYRRAGPSQRQAMVIQYVDAKLKQEPAIVAAEQALMAEVAVVPAVLELAVLSLQHAQAQSDPSARKSLLDEAESNFLAVSRMAGEQAAYQINLVQVYYWQGKHDEGRRLLDRVLGEQKRDPALLVEAAVMLREVGSVSEARTLSEEAYNAAMVPAVKNEAAVIRGLLGEDVDERITWIRRANTDEPHIKAILCEDLARQAMEKGDEPQAIANLKQTIALYESMPESHGDLNNLWIALSQLARLTGDAAAHDRAAAMIQRPRNGPGRQPGPVQCLRGPGRAGHPRPHRQCDRPAVLRRDADFDLLNYLVEDERGREAFAARLRAQSPRQPRPVDEGEGEPAGPAERRVPRGARPGARAAAGRRGVAQALRHTRADRARPQRPRQAAGRAEVGQQGPAEEGRPGHAALAEPILPVARAKGDRPSPRPRRR